jgi:hypothetical protein
MEQIVREDDLRLAWESIPTTCAIYPGTTSTSWRRLIPLLLELEVVR